MQLGRFRREPRKKHFYKRYVKSTIQMDLLSEDRDPLETLHYAITRERGQEKQQRISNTHALNSSGSGINVIQRQRQQTQRLSILPTPPNTNKIPDCWKCGYKFIKGHLDNCPAKKHSMQHLQESRTLRQSMQIRNSTKKRRDTKYIQKHPESVQQQEPTAKKHITRNKHKKSPKHTSNTRRQPKSRRGRNRNRNYRSRKHMLHQGNDGRLDFHQLHRITKLHNSKAERCKQQPSRRILDTNIHQKR